MLKKDLLGAQGRKPLGVVESGVIIFKNEIEMMF